MSELWGVLTKYFPEFADGFLTTLRLVAVAFVIAMIVGTIVASFRVAPARPLKVLGAIYVEYFRNIPLLILLFIIFYGLPQELNIDEMVAGTVGLGLYTAAYVAETIRSGVFAVGKGQIEAALSLGMSYGQALRKVVLPQAIRTVIPPLGSLTIAMIKNSAIVGGGLAVADLLRTGRDIQNKNLQTNETFFWAAVGYLILTVTATIIVRRLETRLTIKR
ncbi:MAG: amino acid ABC transporter permease [Actinomycetota bacterium]|nr:amino acid ABC transporter permease [Actinomycetota bacterium]